uniref:Tudor domain-containing protein n=1 Tax=Timema bartmani TaxID=61472 RepID=A0A7R9I4H5_9NEOP|nr:unnamed protein product [Timema bartmani]
MWSTLVARYCNDLFDTLVVDVCNTLTKTEEVIDFKQPTVETHIKNLVSDQFYLVYTSTCLATSLPPDMSLDLLNHKSGARCESSSCRASKLTPVVASYVIRVACDYPCVDLSSHLSGDRLAISPIPVSNYRAPCVSHQSFDVTLALDVLSPKIDSEACDRGTGLTLFVRQPGRVSMELFVPSEHNAANGDPTESAAMPRLRRAPQHRDTPNIKLISPDLTKTLVLGVGEENYLLSLRKFAESKRLPELQCKVFPLKHGGNVRYYSYIQVGDISCNTVDSGCMTATAAIQLAAKRVLHELSSDECAPASSGATFTQLALCRILQLVNSHPGGLWLKNIPSEYLRVYKESVPEGWKDAVCKCPLLFKEEISDHMTIVTFSDKISTPSLAPASADKKSATVKLPKGHTWNVHVTLVLTASRIYVNLIGEDLSDELVELHIMMDNFYKRSKVPPVHSPQEGNFYAAPINSEWHRVCLKKVTGPMRGILQLIDTGGEVEGELNMVWELKPIFASLPPQAVLCRLAGLEGFAQDMSLKEHISARITKKQFVAVVLSRTPCVTVMLYDTSKEEIINININMAKSISDTARFPKLQVGVRQTAYVSYVCPKEGTLYLTLEHKKYIHYMNIMFNYLMTTDNERPNIVRPSFPVDQGKMYLVSESEGSSWLRAKAKRSSQSKVEVQCIDYGKHVIVHPMQLVVLDNLSPALVNIPSQEGSTKPTAMLPTGRELNKGGGG